MQLEVLRRRYTQIVHDGLDVSSRCFVTAQNTEMGAVSHLVSSRGFALKCSRYSEVMDYDGDCVRCEQCDIVAKMGGWLT